VTTSGGTRSAIFPLTDLRPLVILAVDTLKPQTSMRSMLSHAQMAITSTQWR
jgi:hypothetical protein